MEKYINEICEYTKGSKSEVENNLQIIMTNLNNIYITSLEEAYDKWSKFEMPRKIKFTIDVSNGSSVEFFLSIVEVVKNTKEKAKSKARIAGLANKMFNQASDKQIIIPLKDEIIVKNFIPVGEDKFIKSMKEGMEKVNTKLQLVGHINMLLDYLKDIRLNEGAETYGKIFDTLETFLSLYEQSIPMVYRCIMAKEMPNSCHIIDEETFKLYGELIKFLQNETFEINLRAKQNLVNKMYTSYTEWISVYNKLAKVSKNLQNKCDDYEKYIKQQRKQTLDNLEGAQKDLKDTIKVKLDAIDNQ